MIRRKEGFSLVELLIVIAVIAVLAAVIFPTFAAAKRRSRVASCQSNLRQIYSAFELYLQDWDECYPNTGDPYLWMGRRWRWPLKQYMSLAAQQTPGDPLTSQGGRAGVLLCPDDPLAPTQWEGTSYAYSMSFYVSAEDINDMTGIQQTWSDRTPCTSRRKGDVVFPAQKVLLTEWLSNHEPPRVGFGSWEGGRNYIFADGHSAYLKAKQIKPANDGWPDVNLTRDGLRGQVGLVLLDFCGLFPVFFSVFVHRSLLSGSSGRRAATLPRRS